MNKTQQWLAKNLLGIDVKALAGSFTPPVLRLNNTPVQFISEENGQFIKDGYAANDIVYSILTIAAEKERMAPWAAYKIKDESSLKLYELELAKVGTKDFNWKKTQEYRHKALELFTGDSKLNKILEWPNDNETFQDIVANSGINKRATGNRYLKATLLEGDKNPNKGKPQELHLLPPQHMSITSTGTFPARALEYVLQLGSSHTYTAEEVMHDKLFNPDFDIAAHGLIGMAPLKAGAMTLTRNRSNATASVKSFDNLGPEVLLYVADNRINPDMAVAQAEATRKRLDQMSGLRNRKRAAVSGYAMGAVQLGVSPADLQLVESGKFDMVMLSNIFNFPHIILLPDYSTYSNVEIAERALTSRCCLPYLISFRNHFVRKLRTDWGYKGQSMYVDFDMSVYPELQKDMREMTEWLQKSWWLTIRQRYEMQQIEIPKSLEKSPELDMIFVPSGYTEISQLNPDNLMNNIPNDPNEDL